LKEHYSYKNTTELAGTLPEGKFIYGEKRVRSAPIQLPGFESTCTINGRIDIVAAFKDGSYGVVDFKTGTARDDNQEMYGRQLQAYAYTLEHPARGELALKPVELLGLAYFSPSSINSLGSERIAYEADVQWIPIQKNEDAFLHFINEVITILTQPEPPPPTPTCQWCKYLEVISSRP